MASEAQIASDKQTDRESRTASVVVDTRRSPEARLQPVPVEAVRLDDRFWAPRRRINREITLPSQYHYCEETGRIDNFRRAAGKKQIPFQGIYFNDSDIYKWLEAAAWTLAADPDPALGAMVDAAIGEVAAAQQPDGYLDTYFMFDKAGERWTNLRDMHELYCAGHLIQAAVAHHRATGSERLLEIARRLADHICNTFGPESEGKHPGTCGHEEIEMALVELARDTGDAKYRQQARYFVDARGQGLAGGDAYHQDHKPFRELDRMVGHAVRAVYLNAGAADLVAEGADTGLRQTLERLWKHMTTRVMYVSGGIGSRYEGEAFGRDYELPSERAYAESCAAIGSAMWSWRMLALEGDARYADLLEWTLYNAILPGLSLDGQEYFYQNPLADDGSHRRQPWFGCACCPPNIARMLGSLPGYFYSVSDESIWVHLYAEGTAHITLPNGRTVELHQSARYPWDGDIAIVVEGDGAFALRLRVPGWCEETAELSVNDEPSGAVAAGTYAELNRTWKRGDRVHLKIPMRIRRVEAHPYVAENAGRVALARGPILYCVEGADNTGLDPRDLVLARDTQTTPAFVPDLLGGVVTLRFEAETAAPGNSWQDHLYRGMHEDKAARPDSSREVVAIPYYAWANREPGPMQVWLRTR